MRNIYGLIFTLLISSIAFAQIDKDQLSLDVSKAEAANTEALKAFLWKRYSTATVDGVAKATMTTEFSFNEAGELEGTQVAAETTVKKKPGLRGKAQANAAEDNADYVESALKLAINYTFMSKGQMMDFFDKAELSEMDNVISATASNVFMDGDKLSIQFDKETKLYIKKTFSSLLGADAIDGVISYEKFASGINHASKTTLNLPAKNAKIDAINKDYSKRIE